LVDNSRYVIDGDISGFKKIKIEYFKKLVKYLKSINNILTTKDSQYIQILNQHRGQEDKDNFILRYYQEKVDGKYVDCIQTGNFIGKLYLLDGKQPLEVDIGIRFEKEGATGVLEFLLDYTHSLYAKSIDFNYKKNTKKTNDIVKMLLSKLFLQSLSKAFVMGLPKVYKKIYDTNYSPKGKIDLVNLIAKELPFKGKTPHIKNEKVVVESIAILLLKSIDILLHDVYSISKGKKEEKLSKPYQKEISALSKIKSEIKQSINQKYLDKSTIRKALTHQVLKHPIYSEYKKTLFYANLILNGFKEPNISDTTGQVYGYVTDVSVLWENFLVKLLEQNIDDKWEVKAEPKLKLFKEIPSFKNNYNNSMFPDIVLKHKTEKKVMVFDAKFKRTQRFNREDFYKTATYISYYQSRGYEIVLCGQIYPDIELEQINKNLYYFESEIDFRFFGLKLEEFVKDDVYRKKVNEAIQNFKVGV